MKSKKIEEPNATEWKKIAKNWVKYFDVPSRPSSQEINQYNLWLKHIIKNKNDLNGLVFGLTPEIRKAFILNHYKSHSLDANIEMIFALKNLVKNYQKEIFINANWLDNPLQTGYFDVICGDHILPNVTMRQRKELYKQITRLLKPKGYFINRAFFTRKQRKYFSIEELLNAYETKKISNQTVMEMVFDILLFYQETNNRLVSTEHIQKIITRIRMKEGANTKSKKINKILNLLRNNWVKNMPTKVWLFPYIYEEETEYNDYFRIVDKFVATDHDFGELTPMYLLQEK